MEEEECIIIGSKEEKRNGQWKKSRMHQIGQGKVQQTGKKECRAASN